MKLAGFNVTSKNTWGHGRTVVNNGDVHNVLNTTDRDINIEKMAMSLSRQKRYSGYTEKEYSVAQHCVAMAYSFLIQGDLLKAEIALVHEGDEVLVTPDIVNPFKKVINEHVKPYFDKCEKQVLEYFGLDGFADDMKEVMIADKNMAQLEMTTMMKLNLFSDYWDADKAQKLWLETYTVIQAMKIQEFFGQTKQEELIELFNPNHLFGKPLAGHSIDDTTKKITIGFDKGQKHFFRKNEVVLVCRTVDRTQSYSSFSINVQYEEFKNFLRTRKLTIDDEEFFFPIVREEININYVNLKDDKNVKIELTVDGELPEDILDCNFEYRNGYYWVYIFSFTVDEFHSLILNKKSSIESFNESEENSGKKAHLVIFNNQVTTT